MTDDHDELGTIERAGSEYVARLERVLDHDRQAVWGMLTDPSRLVEWLAPGEIELREGGAAKLNFTDSGTVIDSTVSAFDESRLLEYSWGGAGEPVRPVRWELADEGDATRLTLSLRVPDDEDIARSCAGWEAHLMMLHAAIEGVPIKFPFERFKTSRAAYGAMIPA